MGGRFIYRVGDRTWYVPGGIGPSSGGGGCGCLLPVVAVAALIFGIAAVKVLVFDPKPPPPLPSAVLGNWAGEVHQEDFNAPNGYDAFTVNLHVQNADNVGQSIGTFQTVGSPGCDFNTHLKAGFSNSIDFTADYASGPQNCLPGDALLTINQDGTVSFFLQGLTLTEKGTLARQ